MFRLLLADRRGWALLAVVLLAALGCDLPLHTASDTQSQVFATGDEPTIQVETFNGTVDVSNGDADEVVVEVTRRASGFDPQSAERNLEHILVTMEERDGKIRVVVKRSGPSMGNSGASVAIAAPRKAKLSLSTSNGPITCEGMQGRMAARTSNARIKVFEGQGTIAATTSNGAIDIEAAGAEVEARTSNARIRFEGTLAGKENEFKSSNGGIEISLPRDSSFLLDSSTSNARIDCEFEVKKERSSRKRHLVGTVGDHPAYKLKLATSNAPIRISEAE